MAELVEGEDRPLVRLEGDYSDLTPRDQLALTYLAQGKSRGWVCKKVGMAAETLHALSNQSSSRSFVSELTQGAHLQMEALYVKSVEAVRSVLVNGKDADKIKAARLQMESTKRIGSMTMPQGPSVNFEERLLELGKRLLMLNDNSKTTIQTRRTEHGYEVRQERDITPPASADGAGQGDSAPGQD